MSRDRKFDVPEDGAYCINDCGRYCLPSTRATCTHKDICEDCWPNGCDECETEADPGVRLLRAIFGKAD